MASRLGRAVHASEDALAFLSIGLMALILVGEVVARKFLRTGISDSTAYVQHLVLVATFVAAAVTSREKRHLSLASGWTFGEPFKSVVGTMSGVLSAALLFAFSVSAFSFAWNAFSPAERIAFLPKRLVVMVMVAGFLTMGVRAVAGLEKKRLRGPAAAAAALLAVVIGFEPLVNILGGFVPAWLPGLSAVRDAVGPILHGLATPMIVLLVVLGFLGVPIFLVLGGAGYFLFVHAGQPLEIIPNQAYTVLTGHAIPAIPLFAA
ncbi:MAG: TRAP transporter small permease subunit, partial [Candidatus Aminicenantes bacterium]